MRAGKLRHRIAIQAATETQDSYGQPEKTWATVATRWGSIEPLNGREAAYAKQVHEEVTHKVMLRYYSGLNTKHRLLFDNRELEIISILNKDEINHEQTILAVEK